MTFGEKLSRLRKENNYTQEQLADLLGVSRQSVSKWESDLAYPETDKLVKLGELFDCSMDYLLKEDVTEKRGARSMDGGNVWEYIKKQFHERKSEKTVFGMPLWHIGKNARGFFAIGLKARGVFAIGLTAQGLVSLGLFSLGVLSFGLLSLGLFAAGAIAFGLLAVGSVAVGLFVAGAIGVGIISFGALSVGCFSAGALSVGRYAAFGDHAYAMIALGRSVAEGSVYSRLGKLTAADLSTVADLLDANVPAWLGWAKEIFYFFIA